MVLCPTTAAYNYANGKENEGAGFLLVLTMRSGVVHRGGTQEPKDGLIWMDLDNDNGRPAAIRLEEVASAEVEW